MAHCYCKELTQALMSDIILCLESQNLVSWWGLMKQRHWRSWLSLDWAGCHYSWPFHLHVLYLFFLHTCTHALCMPTSCCTCAATLVPKPLKRHDLCHVISDNQANLHTSLIRCTILGTNYENRLWCSISQYIYSASEWMLIIVGCL